MNFFCIIAFVDYLLQVHERRLPRWQLLAGSTFLFCLLLVGTVSTLIYIQLSSACQNGALPSHTPDIQETVHLVGTDQVRE